ncbi:MAG: hypothetical protein JST62_09950 [Bacteroidetes bacterium]|nr:hypothetical protein [Bacteroidota bacterium]
MKKILFSLLIMVSGLASSQMTLQPKKIILVNGCLTGQNFLNKNKQNIKSTRIVANAATLPQQYKNIANIVPFPISIVDVKENYYDKILLSDFNERYHLVKDNPIYFDGNLISEPNVKILGNDLETFAVIEKDGKKFLSIESSK